MPFLIRSTKVTQPTGGFVVEMVLSDDSEMDAASDLIEFRATIRSDDQYPRLAELQKVALQRARGLLDAEIQRLELAKGRTP